MEIVRIGRMFACYLLKEGNSAVLVDTGPAFMRRRVLRALKDAPLRLIVLTHGHHDHVANAAALSGHFRVPVAMHAGDLPLVQHPDTQPLQVSGVLGRCIRGMSTAMTRLMPMAPLTPDVQLEEGDSLLPYGIAASVITLPGHTKGSIGILTDDGQLLAGDAVMHMMPSPTPSLFEDQAMMRRSIQRIEAIHPRVVYAGHGGPRRYGHAASSASHT